LFDAIIVGSGPAGVFAARALRGLHVVVVDVGFKPPDSLAPSMEGSAWDSPLKTDLHDFLIGPNFEGLRNIWEPDVNLKLKSPLMSFVVKDWERLAPVQGHGFCPMVSLAKGGLANAWGAGVYRFSSEDLAEFPVALAELQPFYDQVSDHIGVSGAEDDLAVEFGLESHLLPPVRLSRLSSALLAAYERRRDKMRRAGVKVGFARLAVLTEPRGGRGAYSSDNLDFYRPHNPAIYHPSITLDELIDKGEVQYEPGRLVLCYEDRGSHVEVVARNLRSGLLERLPARSVFIAAGTLNTTRIVLESHGDYESRLPILDNPMSCVPFFHPSDIGGSLDGCNSSLAQLNVVYRDNDSGQRCQGSVFGTTGPLRSDVLFRLPFAVSSNRTLAKHLAPAMALVMLFYPAPTSSENHVRLNTQGALEIHYQAPRRGHAERSLIRAFRKLGFFSASWMCQYPPMGSSLHYAGTLPMRQVPGRYQTDRMGRLFGSSRVYVVDGACFSTLPAKNLTMTIMANAMRIATGARSQLS